MSSNSVCNHPLDEQIGLSRSSDFVSHSYDYRRSWTPLSPITMINRIYKKMVDCDWFSERLFAT